MIAAGATVRFTGISSVAGPLLALCLGKTGRVEEARTIHQQTRAGVVERTKYRVVFDKPAVGEAHGWYLWENEIEEMSA